MAYYNNQDEDNQNVQGMNSQNNQQNQQGTTANTQLSTGVGSDTAPVSTGPQSQVAPKSSSSGMTGFQNYQKANQGAATNKLAGAATQNVSNQANKAKTNINQATTSFGQKVDQGSLSNMGEAVNDVKAAVDAARNITAPAQQQAAQQSSGTVSTAQQVPSSSGVASQYNLDPSKVSRFQDVINAKYQGPESLRQSGDYNKASNSVATAQTALDQTKNAQGRQELLRNLYSQGGNYTQGLNNLDAGLLNASKAGVSQLQAAAQNAGNLQSQLDQAQINSANLAQNRTNQINDIRNQSREAFTTGKTAEETATENRLQNVLDNWNKLPDYFKSLIANSGNTDLNSLEAGILGINSGEGLYNLGKGAIATGVADKEKLISRDEQARQAALAALGGLDAQGLLSTNLKYGDASKAGTQSALDALDLAKTRENLNAAEQAFQKYATDTDLVGSGAKKNKSSGKYYYATQNANLGDLLKNAGYNFGQTGNENNIGNADLLNSLAKVSGDNNSSASESGAGAGLNAQMEATSNLGDGQSLAENAADLFGASTGLNYLTGALGLGSVGNVVGGLFGSRASAASSIATAKQIAQQDLQNKVQNALKSQGFSNRANITNNDTTTARLAALQALLAGTDKTNT